uniref:Eukaryotic translation initiation factor 3 subunit I n=1 Tax=Clonorchis sinensis TaxID=79923 RepID=A1L049_CLOSI|nr:TGF-beta receptor interacting protein 1 [Clonorchis sinensis]
MRPIILNGHERPITRLCYNRDGDLIFTAAKNSVANVWFSANGERLGSFHGHDGVIWWLDVDWSTKNLLTASGDYHCKLWDIETGKQIEDFENDAPARTCGISFCGNLLMFTTDETFVEGKNKKSEIIIVDKRDPSSLSGASPVLRVFSADKTKVTGAIWGPLNKTIICGHDSGALTVLDVRSGQVLHQIASHKGPVTDIQMHLHLPMFITGSKDHTAKLYSAYDLSSIRTYTTERPINSAAISPTRDHVLLGGGQEAHEVTTTAVGQGKFDARFYHLIYQEEFGRVKGHFGPINSVSFTPDGTGFATGGEEGYVRLHTFDLEYADLD